jgi:hypothetical protein
MEKEQKYVKEPITKSYTYGSDDVSDNLFKVYNFLMQRVKPKFNFTVSFFTLSDSSQTPKNVINMKGYDSNITKGNIDIYMKLSYCEDSPQSNYNPSVVNSNIVRKNGDDFIKLIIDEYKKEFGQSFPFKFEKNEEEYSETVGYLKLRYHLPFIFKMSR